MITWFGDLFTTDQNRTRHRGSLQSRTGPPYGRVAQTETDRRGESADFPANRLRRTSRGQHNGDAQGLAQSARLACRLRAGEIENVDAYAAYPKKSEVHGAKR